MIIVKNVKSAIDLFVVVSNFQKQGYFESFLFNQLSLEEIYLDAIDSN